MTLRTLSTRWETAVPGRWGERVLAAARCWVSARYRQGAGERRRPPQGSSGAGRPRQGHRPTPRPRRRRKRGYNQPQPSPSPLTRRGLAQAGDSQGRVNMSSGVLADSRVGWGERKMAPTPHFLLISFKITCFHDFCHHCPPPPQSIGIDLILVWGEPFIRTKTVHSKLHVFSFKVGLSKNDKNRGIYK